MISERHLKIYQIIALNRVTESSMRVYIDNCYKHISKTYHTALHTAHESYSIPEAIVMFLEDQYSELDEDEITSLKEELLTKKTIVLEPTTSITTSDQQDDEDEIWIAQQMKAVKDKEDKQPSSKDIEAYTANALKKFNKSIGDFNQTVSAITEDDKK